MDSPADVLQRSAWRPLVGASRDSVIPSAPRLYRIRRVGREDLDYIGQTVRSLQGRLGMMSGILAGVMPYADPHTAAHHDWTELNARLENARQKATIIREGLVQLDAADQQFSDHLTRVEGTKI